ncbi:MAG: glycosyltransferase [Chloroflexota bacterium]
MKITILTVGSRGDVQPYIALGLGLQDAGHQVRLATESGFESFVRQHGLDFAPLRADFIQLAQSSKGKAAISGKGSFSLMKEVMPMLRRMLDDAWDVSRDAQTIIYHPKAMAGYHIAEKLNVPAFLAMALPAYSPTQAFANPALGGADYGNWLNRLSYSFMLKAAVLPYKGMLDRWRRERLDLPPFKTDLLLRGRPVPKLYAYSHEVLPSPADWDAATHVTGYWFLPSPIDWLPPPDLQAFLDAGPAPVYVGFGSMASQDAERVTQTVLEAARAAGQRLVLATGWGGMGAAAASDSVFLLQAVPHDWLFPRCAAVVHHGGAGTTGTGLWAGRPTLVCPFFGDQPFWGRRVYELGVGPQPIPQKKLATESLARAISQLANDETMRRRAQALGERIRAEDGVARAVEVIHQHLS